MNVPAPTRKAILGRPVREVLTPREAAALLGVSPKTLYRRGRAGKLGRVGQTPGGQRRYDAVTVRAIAGSGQ